MAQTKRKVTHTVTEEVDVVECDGPGCQAFVQFNTLASPQALPLGWLVLNEKSPKMDPYSYDRLYFHHVECLYHWASDRLAAPVKA